MSAVPTEADAVRGDLNGKGEGVIGVMSGRDKISLHSGALRALQDHHEGKFGGMKIALASSANTPFAEKIGRKALSMLEVVPGVTVWSLLMRDWEGRDVNQIGRQPPKLSPNKAKSHFPNLKVCGAGWCGTCSVVGGPSSDGQVQTARLLLSRFPRCPLAGGDWDPIRQDGLLRRLRTLHGPSNKPFF